MAIDLGDYNTVPERIAQFRTAHPLGSLRPLDPAKPFHVVEIAGKSFVVYAAAAYRSPDDPCPGVGIAWEPVPGLTNFTKNSELQNAETSAWGRAIVAVGAADAKKGIATRDDIERRQEDEKAIAAHTERVKKLADRVKAEHQEANVKGRYPWPWSAEACDEIEAFLDGEAAA